MLKRFREDGKDLANGARQSLNDAHLTRTHVFWLLLAALAWLIEAYDIGLMGVALVPMRHLWSLSASDTGILVSASTIGIVLGVIPAGYLIDRYGRKRLLVASLLFYSLVSLLTGWAGSWQEVAWLRLIAGLGLGAMFPIPYTLLAELSPNHLRGRAAGILDAFLSVGYFAAPLLAAWLVPALGIDAGWRLLFFVSGIGLIYAYILHRYLPESPRWLISQGRRKESSAILGRLRLNLDEPSYPKDWPPDRAARLFQSPYLKRTIMMWIAFPAILFMFYAIMSFMPTVLVKEGFSSRDAYLFSSFIMAASIPGKFLEGWLVERWGRKSLIITFSLAGGVAALLFPLARGAFSIVAVGICLAFFGIAVDPAIKVFSAEQYPTTLRGKGVAFTEGVGRLLGGALAPYIMALVLANGGISRSFDFVALVAAVGAVSVAALGNETKGLALEERASGSKSGLNIVGEGTT